MSHTERGHAGAGGRQMADAELSALHARLEDMDLKLFDTLAKRIELCAAIAQREGAWGAFGTGRDAAAVEARVASAAAKAGLDAGVAWQLHEIMDRAASGMKAPASTSETEEAPSVLARSARRIDHAAIAVRDLEVAISMLQKACGFVLIERRRVEGEISGMISATMRAGGVTLVVCQGTSPRSNVSRYIEAYGPGVQHLAIEVDDEALVIEDLKSRGANLLTDIVHAPGLDQAFTRREANTGMQFEFVARTGKQGFDDENVRKMFAAMERDDIF